MSLDFNGYIFHLADVVPNIGMNVARRFC